MYPIGSFITLCVLATNMVAHGLDCFKCVSLDRENPACEDPFHNNYTADLLVSPCMSSRKNRNGLFPATACIKLNGVYEETGQTMVVRSCALDSGTLTVDTEIVRMSHCGGFYFEDRYVRGCLQSCFEDACNAAGGGPRWRPMIMLSGLFLASVARIALAR
ncbi:uncharacterized protein LOC119399277 [Rhipicephalus sanguineus]|uniref:uncharacterized protein LOC119399277 n=1 Tax=Rhipicephalus sanguineus TaxID=34632 RepID=UPI001894CC43|nr:uncharacterized protein LOC119399277 [Rhipicephalus sanguineus]